MSRIPDEVLEYYAELFIEQGVREQGVTFEHFLYLPEAYLKRSNSTKRDRRVLACFLLGVAAFFQSCGRAADAEATASGFIEQYYVKVNLARAKTFTDGLATRKIEKEQSLVEGVTGDAGGRHRDVAYRLLEKREEGERIFFVYDLDIKGQGVPILKKRSLISVGRIGGAWRITNFHDFDS